MFKQFPTISLKSGDGFTGSSSLEYFMISSKEIVSTSIPNVFRNVGRAII